MEKVSGSVERITFYNPENGYSVIRLLPDQKRLPGLNREGLVTVVGYLPEISPGEFLRLSGDWEKHPQHGLQFSAELCEQSLPASQEGIRLYLSSGIIKGIGKSLSERIVGLFGEDTFNIIENHPEELMQVRDIGKKRLAMICDAWQEQKQIREVVMFLHGYGVSTNLAIKIYKTYHNESIQVVQNDPYRLAHDITGIGFKTADKIARLLGLPIDHPSRLEAGVVFALSEISNDGHVYSPEQALLDRASLLLELPTDQILPAIQRLKDQDRVRLDQFSIPSTPDHPTRVTEEQAVYLTPFYISEVNVAQKIQQLLHVKSTRLSDLKKLITQDRLSRLAGDLSPEQIQAIQIVISTPVSIITGGPGTGKTTAMKALILLLEEGHKKYALASPTGRAAKRLSEATGRPACTIHRLLEPIPGGGFHRGSNNPLDVDLLVIDESSMIDILLTNSLLKAVRPGTHLLLVGDIDQLPSVGAGDVLRDLIKSGAAPVTRLSQIFRQAAGSHIITNAHRINQGLAPVFITGETDFYLFPAKTPDEAAQWVSDVVSVRIPKKFRLDPLNEIQVLAPMYRGPAGVDNLNTCLQSILNPASQSKIEHTLFGQLFRCGDKVMQTENNYDKDVFNGDIGWISKIDPEEQILQISYDQRKVNYEWSEADQLVLAYAISVHKSQGSEFPAVVIPIVTQHYLMLQRNLLYTAVTRARKLCVLVGDHRAIHIAVRNHMVSQRNSALDIRLQPDQDYNRS